MTGEDRQIIPAAKTRTEIVVQKSRFIASAGPAFSVEDARQFISEIKLEYPDATHHVPVFLIGHGAGVVAHPANAMITVMNVAVRYRQPPSRA